MVIPKPTLVVEPKAAPFAIDATVFTTGMSCAQKLEYQYVLNLRAKDGRSPSIEMGIVVHKMLEGYYRSRRDGKPHDEAVTIALTWGAAMMLPVDPSEKDDRMIAGRKVEPVQNLTYEDNCLIGKTMEEYFAFYAQDSWTPLEVEHAKQGLLYEDRDIRIIWKAILDLVTDTNQGVYPVDHKTMRMRRDTVSLNNQLMGQSILVGSRGVIINKVGFQKTLKPSEKFTRPIIAYTAEQLHEWATELVPYWAKQMVRWKQTGYYPRNYTSCENKYGYCQFKSVCECPANMREEMIKNLFEEGEPWDVKVD